MAHRQANPYLVQKFGWAIDRATVEYEVEQYNAQICRAMGWKNFIVTDENIAAPPPKSFPLPRRAVAGDEQQGPSPSLLKRVSHAGEKVRGLIEGYNAIQAWRDSGKSPVGFPLAEKRASTCAACPLNEPGDWTRWFTIPYSEKLRKEFQKSFWVELKTDQDDKLKVCSGCLCPLRALVFCPIEFITPTLDAKKRAALARGNNCWQLSEAV